MCIANIVPRIMAWLFIFSHLEKRRVSILIKSNLSCILLWSMPLRTYLKKICLSQNSKDFLIFLPEIIYLGLVPFEVNFLYLWGKSWDFFFNVQLFEHHVLKKDYPYHRIVFYIFENKLLIYTCTYFWDLLSSTVPLICCCCCCCLVTKLCSILCDPMDCSMPGFLVLHYLPGFTGGSDGKASVYNTEDPGSIPGLGRSPGEGNGNPLQYSCLENLMDREAW